MERNILKMIYLTLAIVAIAAMALALVLSGRAGSEGVSRVLSVVSGGSIVAAILVRLAIVLDVARKSFKRKNAPSD